MPRIAGVDIPNSKKTVYALRYIHGIGLTTARRVVEEARVNGDKKAGELTEDELSRLASVIDRGVEVEGPLRRRVQGDVSRLRRINCWRGLRHSRGLPVRGQRTRTNARTRKGRKKTVAGKKSVKEMR